MSTSYTQTQLEQVTDRIKLPFNYDVDKMLEEIAKMNLANFVYYDVKVLMTLTTPNCPVAETLPKEVEDKIKTIKEVNDCEVEITFEPEWNKDLMSEEAKLELGML